MGRSPCCDVEGIHKGTWSAQEDTILINYIRVHGEGKWTHVPRRAAMRKELQNAVVKFLRPDIKRGNISEDEEDLIIRLHKLLGNRWSLIAGRLPGRTDNEIKNYWNTILRKKVEEQKSTPNKQLHKPQEYHQLFETKASASASVQFNNNPPPLLDNAAVVTSNTDKDKPSTSKIEKLDDSLDRLMDLDINDFLLSDPPNDGIQENMVGGVDCNLSNNFSCAPNFQLSAAGEIDSVDLLIDKIGPENQTPFHLFQPNNGFDLKSSPPPTLLDSEDNWIF